MPIDQSHVGRCYPPTAQYEVSAAKIAEFAAALGDDHPAYRGDRATAPPTFLAIVAAAAWGSLFSDPELGLALRRVVHADQRFAYHRHVRAGDVLTATLTIDTLRLRGPVEMISVSLGINSADERVCDASATFVHTREGSTT